MRVLDQFVVLSFLLALTFFCRLSIALPDPQDEAYDEQPYAARREIVGESNATEATPGPNVERVPIHLTVRGGKRPYVNAHSRRGSDGEPFIGPLLKPRMKAYREPPIPVDQRNCPRGHQFMYSWCWRAKSTSAWTIACKAPPNIPFEESQVVSYGECQGHNNGASILCIDGKDMPDPDGKGYQKATANCFYPEYFTEILGNMLGIDQPARGGDPANPKDVNSPNSDSAARDNAPAKQGSDKQSAILTGVGPPRGQHVALETLLTSEDRVTVLKATHMQVSAQKAQRMGNVDTWGELINGHQECNDCSSLAMWDVPPNTERVVVNVELEPQSPSGLVFFFNGKV